MLLKVAELKDALNRVFPAIGNSKNFTLTVLPKSKDLVLSAVKGSFAIFHTIEGVAENDEAMNIEVNGDLFRATLMKFNCETMEMGMDSNCKRLNIRALDGIPFSIWNSYSDLGIITKLDDKSSCHYKKELNIKNLPAYINGTAHALDTACSGGNNLTDSRKASFFLETDDENIRITTTDGYRISTRSGAMNDIKHSYIIPGSEMKSVISMLGEDATIRIPTKGEYVQIVGGGTVVIMPVLSGDFYDTQSIIKNVEDSCILTVTAVREDLISICEMMGLYDSKIMLNINDSKLSVSTAYVYGGSEGTDLDIEKDPEDKNLSVAYSSKLLADALKSLRGYRVDMKFSKNNHICEICTHVEEGKVSKPGKAVEIVLPINPRV